MTPSQKPQDGGAAFPLHPGIVPDWTASTGMTLRDWFAGQAIAWAGMKEWASYDEKHAAERAYRMADAMLAAREDQP